MDNPPTEPPFRQDSDPAYWQCLDEIEKQAARIAELEAELHRVRTTETAAAHELDKSHDDEARKKFKATCDRLARVAAERDTLVEALEEIANLRRDGPWTENEMMRISARAVLAKVKETK